MADAPKPISRPHVTGHQRAQEAHFIKRARERYGLKVSAKYYAHLCEKVREQKQGTKPLYANGPHCTVWIIRAGGLPMRVVFDASTDRLATCLPIAHEHVPVKRFIREQRREARRRERGIYRPHRHG